MSILDDAELPELPTAEFSLRLRRDAAGPATDLADLLAELLPNFA